MKDSKLKNEKVKARLCKIYDLERKTIVETMEKLKQLVTATAKKIERYNGHLKQYRENTKFWNKQWLFYTSLGENAEQKKLGPCKDDVLKFWT